MNLYELLDSNIDKEQEKLYNTILYKNKIEVRQYLTLREKFDLILEAMNEGSESNGYVSLMKTQLAFRVIVLRYYTNIDFEDLDDMEIYDICFNNNIITDIFNLIPEKEWQELYDMLNDSVKEVNEANKSILNALDTINKLLTKGLKNSLDLAENFDAEKVDKVMELAKSVGYKEV